MEDLDDKTLSPMKSIRKHCLSCSCGSSNEVALCPITNCNLYPFRFGKNPNRKGCRVMTDEQKQASKERLLAYHAKKKASKELPE